MPLTGEEIRSCLSAFAVKWSVHDGSERSEAQTFLTSCSSATEATVRSSRLVERRRAICEADQIGLTALYNVASTYGWPREIAQDGGETNRRLLALNQEIVEGRRPYKTFDYLR